jgi:hypothetical protein
MYVTLSPDLTVSIEAFHCQSVPAFLRERGVIEGSTERINRFVLEKSPDAMAYRWCAIKTMVIMPSLPITEGDDPGSHAYQKYLRSVPVPHYILHAWLTRSDDPDKFDETRELVITFFRDDVDSPISEMVQEATQKLDWYKESALIPTTWH